MKYPWVCSQCQQIIDWPPNRMEITEMCRTVSHDYVLYTEVLRKVCKGCAVTDERLEAHPRNPRGTPMRLDTPTRMDQVLDFIVAFVKENQHAPTIRQICDGVGLKSTSHVHGLLNRLQDEGRITLVPGYFRAIRINP